MRWGNFCIYFTMQSPPSSSSSRGQARDVVNHRKKEEKRRESKQPRGVKWHVEHACQSFRQQSLTGPEPLPDLKHTHTHTHTHTVNLDQWSEPIRSSGSWRVCFFFFLFSLSFSVTPAWRLLLRSPPPPQKTTTTTTTTTTTKQQQQQQQNKQQQQQQQQQTTTIWNENDC